MLISTGCSAGSNHRYRTNLNNNGNTSVTRSSDANRGAANTNSANIAHNRYGRPMARGYNVRNISRRSEGSLVVNEYAQGRNINTRNLQSARKTTASPAPRSGSAAVTRSAHNTSTANKGTDNKITPMAPKKAHENQPRKESTGTHGTHRSHTNRNQPTNNQSKKEAKKPAAAHRSHANQQHTANNQLKKETPQAAGTHRSHTNQNQATQMKKAHENRQAGTTTNSDRLTRAPGQAHGQNTAAGTEDFRIRRALHTPGLVDGTNHVGGSIPRDGFRTGNLGRNLRRNHGVTRRSNSNGFLRRNLTINDNMNTNVNMNNVAARSQRTGNGYVGNFNRGTNGVINDYRFDALGGNRGLTRGHGTYDGFAGNDEFLRTDGFYRTNYDVFPRNNNNSMLGRSNASFVRGYNGNYGYNNIIPGSHNSFRDDFVRYDSQDGFVGNNVMGNANTLGYHRGPAPFSYGSAYTGLGI